MWPGPSPARSGPARPAPQRGTGMAGRGLARLGVGGGGRERENNTLPKRPKQANPRSNLKQYLPCPKTIDLGPKQYLWASKQTPPYASLVCFNTPAPQNKSQGGLLDEALFSKQYPQGSVCAPPCRHSQETINHVQKQSLSDQNNTSELAPQRAWTKNHQSCPKTINFRPKQYLRAGTPAGPD